MLFIYRHNQRTTAEIESEWQFISFLDANGIPVAPAILTRDGSLLLNFQAPEGLRHGVLSKYVPGKHLRHRPSHEATSEYGRLIARLHTLSDNMSIQLERPENDVAEQLTRFTAVFEKEFPEETTRINFMRQSADRITQRLNHLPKRPPYYGMIHGDVIRANAQVGDNGQVTLLDFDLCGPGWRAYDIASYLITVKGTAGGKELEQAFLDGYTSIRHLDSLELETIPLFEAARAIFTLGVPVLNIDHWGKAAVIPWLDEYFKQIEFCMAELDSKEI